MIFTYTEYFYLESKYTAFPSSHVSIKIYMHIEDLRVDKMTCVTPSLETRLRVLYVFLKFAEFLKLRLACLSVRMDQHFLSDGFRKLYNCEFY